MARYIVSIISNTAVLIMVGTGCYQAGQNEGLRRGCTTASWNTISEYDKAVEECKRRYP